MKRLAQLGFLSFALAACGGRVDLDAPGNVGPDADVLYDTPIPDEGPPIEGFRSYDAKISGETVTMLGGGPPPPSASPASEGKSFRIDLDAGLRTDGGARALFAAPWADAVMVRACCGSKVTFTAGADKALVGFSAAGGYWRGGDSWESLTVVFDTTGRPIEGTITGRTFLEQGDVAWSGTISAKVTFGPDVSAPSFRTSSSPTFASVPLPWDEHLIEASEPYGKGTELTAFVGEAAKGMKATPLTQSTWLGDAPRGFRLRLTDWDLKMPIRVGAPPVSDPAGNVTVSAAAMQLQGAYVAQRAVPYLRFDDYAGAAMMWGDAKPSTSCGAGKSCIAIGPFKHSYCSGGSKGGVATRLPSGLGIVNASVRAVAKRIATYGGGVIPPGAIRLSAARPGEKAVVGEDTLKWPTTTGTEVDTGWTTLSLKAPGGAETGVAVSAGGVGSTTSGCAYYGGPPMPEEWEITVYVEAITLTK